MRLSINIFIKSQFTDCFTAFAMTCLNTCGGKLRNSAQNSNYEPANAMKIRRCSVATQGTIPSVQLLVT